MIKLNKEQCCVGVKGEHVNFQNVGTANEVDGTSIIALVLLEAFQLQNMTGTGSNTQADVDRDRFAYLNAANVILPPDKQLSFYIARLQYVIPD